MTAITRCKRCRKEITWVRTSSTGKLVALDAKSSSDGGYFLDLDAHPVPLAIRIGPFTIPPRGEALPRHDCHFDTCTERATA